MTAHSSTRILTALDRWYRRHARVLPWRIGPEAADGGEKPDPYLIWLSEVMLQQTTIPHAAPYFVAFRKRWPTARKLAAASWEDVSAAWAGLGYYSRARNLHACAKAVTERGGFPQDAAGLRELPGIGPYTANAIAAIAFGEKVAPVDGNIERVMSRLYAIGSDGTETGWRKAKAEIVAQAQNLFDALKKDQRAGDLAQALMDLGATICTPKKPACAICPLMGMCAARAEGDPDRYPVKAAKKDRPTRHGSAFVLTRDSKVLLTRREPTGLLGGMMMPPTSAWETKKPADPLAEAPGKFAWDHIGEVRHVFTHFALKLHVYRAEAPARAKLDGQWLNFQDALASLPTVGRKAVALALGSTAKRR
ncbi:MAG TPA: A/G-specific adenine glycosylase [Hyphomonadaceae bacterium]|nr:A/G-specific adenine glycosylase [Hyphomonadaceae bacterium]